MLLSLSFSLGIEIIFSFWDRKLAPFVVKVRLIFEFWYLRNIHVKNK